MSDATVPEVPRTAKRSIWDRLSIVWLVPLFALLIALGVAWQNYNDQGPVIEIRFPNATGVATEETEVRYRDVSVGLVEDVRFSEDLAEVIVEVRLDKSVAAFVDEGAQFWVVRPEVTAQGISGLDTVLSGVYIEGLWDTVPGTPAFEFEGRENPPLLRAGQEGLEFMLRSTDGSLSGNTPIVFKGVAVGRVGTAMVSLDGFSVEARAVVYAPYDNLVTTSTRFWDTSGFSLSFGSGGAELDFGSLASLIQGGITFDTFISGSGLAENEAQFTVFDGPDSARASVFNRNDGATLDLVAIFDGNVSGLTTGAPVELNGLRIGEVSGLNGIVDDTPSGDRRVRLQTILSIQPSRLGLEGETNREDALGFLAEQVAGGMRARLVTGSIFTGGLKIQLVSAAPSGAGSLDLEAQPFPRIPVTASELTDVASTAQDTLARIDALPIEELMQGATDFLNAGAVLIGSEATQSVPAEVAALLADVRGVVGSEAVQALPAQVGALMSDLDGSVASVQAILASVNEEALVAEVAGALQSVTQLTDEVEAALAEVPALLREITTLAERAGELDVETLIAEITTLAANAGTLLAADATQGLPGEVSAALATLDSVLAEARGTIATLNENNGVARVLAAADAAGQAAGSLDTAIAGLPELVAQFEAVAANAAGLPLDALVARITALATDAQVLVGAEATLAIPGRVNAVTAELEATLAQITALVRDLNEADATARVLAAADAAGQAAGSLDTALAGVPDLVVQIEAVAANAAGLPLDALVARITALASDAQVLLGSEATQAVPAQVNAVAAELEATLAQITTLVRDLNEADATARVLAAIDATTTAADLVGASVDGLPAVIDEIGRVASTAADLPLDDLVSRVSGLAAQAQTLIGAEATQALPAQLGAAVTELQLTLAEITTLAAEMNANGGIERLLAAIDAASGAATSVTASVEGVPALVQSLQAVASDAEALELDALLAEVTTLVQNADTILAQDTTRALPGELNAALAELRLSLAAFNDGDAIANTNAALLAARRAADEIAAAAAALPPLMRQTTALLAQADSTLAGFEETSPAIRDARAALREISEAADAVSSLARAIERNPNSLISGR